MSSSTGVTGAERNLFLGARIPPYIKSLYKLLTDVDKQLFRQLLKLALLDFESTNVQSDIYLSIKKSSNENCNIDYIYGALLSLLRSALSFPEGALKQENFVEDLRELKIQEEFIQDLSNIVYGSKRRVITHSLNSLVPHLPKLEKIRWRVEVTISTSILSRVLEPTVLMEIIFSNGQRETFEVHPSQFHKLRFAVATLLKEMKALEMRNVLKL